MNRKQRESNRSTASRLNRAARHARLMAHTCENCGEPGGHWVSVPQSLVSMMAGLPEDGFWTCAEYYGPDGRRINP